MKFTKMHGLGNDFIMLDGKGLDEKDYPALAVKMCDRHLGVGADGIILVLPSSTADIRMRIVNADGSEANMCGNGIRCFAKHVYERGIMPKPSFTVETFAGPIKPVLNIEAGKVASVRVDMGRPGLERGDIPMLGPAGRVLDEPLQVDGETYRITSLLMGVPHTMVFVADAAKVDLARLGPAIEKHPSFPRKTNVNFVQVINGEEIKIRTWERGAGATMACGTGSCASAVAASLLGRTGREVIVHLAVGDLAIKWAEDDTVYMTGPAADVFSGETLN